MTENSLNSLHPLHNPLCDGCNCKDPLGKVRIIRLDDSSNAHLCHDCYKHEVIEGGLVALPFSLLPIYFPPEEAEATSYSEECFSGYIQGYSYDFINEGV